MYVKTHIYVYTSKLVHEYILEDLCLCADSTSELDVQNISNIKISGSFTILQTHRYRSTSQCPEPRARSEMQSTFGDSVNVWTKTSRWPPVDECSEGYCCERTFKDRYWEVADHQYSSPISVQGSDVHMLATYNMVSAGMFFTNVVKELRVLISLQ
jgi:hypothetical protein